MALFGWASSPASASTARCSLLMLCCLLLHPPVPSAAAAASATTTPLHPSSSSSAAQQLVVDPDDRWTSLNRTEFTANTALRLVAIESNHLLTLGTTLARHRQLHTLRLNDNAQLDPGATDAAAQLRSASLHTLELNGCRLRRLLAAAGGDSAPFAGLPQLRTLSLERNGLATVPANLLAGTNVSALSLCGNAAFAFPADGSPLLNSSRLRVFRCNRCGVTYIHTGTLRLLPQLERLELNANRLLLIAPLAFQWTARLSALQLNDNRLQSFALEALEALPALRELCLDCNRFGGQRATAELRRRYVHRGLRGACPLQHALHPERPVQRLEDVADVVLPGISDAYMAVYVGGVVLVQAVLALVLWGWCVRERRAERRHQRRQQTRRSSTHDESAAEFDYAAGITNDSMVYRYVN